MIKIKLIGYHFQNCPGFCVERPTGSGDYLLLYLRRPTEIMKDGHYIKVPENTFILYEKNKPQIYRHIKSENSDAAANKLYNYFRSAIKNTLARYKRFFAPEGTQRYYTSF